LDYSGRRQLPGNTGGYDDATARRSIFLLAPRHRHYNALRTDELAPEVARAYGIERSANRVMLNVSLLRRDADGRTAPVDGTVTATARNLNGQLKNFAMRRITEGASVYFIGEVGISGTEILVFDIDATPADAPGKYSVQFKREFVAG